MSVHALAALADFCPEVVLGYGNITPNGINHAMHALAHIVNPGVPSRP